MQDDEVIGKQGTVLLRIPGGEVPGKVSVEVRGSRETFIAYADTAIEPRCEILVFNSRGERKVDVMMAPWSQGD
ncbi:MAG: hypothetical protein QOF57_1757 [Frankiaceae bacterium]|jgi:hypothetical protein|nr:hypothetical protein [Frankiaceae bacterium]MDQ1726719.1 hypothetical protein [Frankiaceae bacterium]